MDTPQGPRTGTHVGPYLLHEEIGRGGMGVVYRATRADVGQEFALKLMLPELSSNPKFRERFIAEAEAAPELNHPNIVPVHDAAQIGGELYIAMRLVRGPNLKALTEETGPVEPKRAIAVLRQVATALDFAHEIGVVHRDIKPQNILVTTEDESGEMLAYVTDFGLVKPAGSESTASRTGEVFGSIQYMSPEQVEAMPTDGRADVYSLGCVAFELLTGTIPFDRDNEVGVLWAHVHEDPPRVTSVRPDLPGGLDIPVANAMAKHPDDRYLTCGEFVDALEAGLTKNIRVPVMPLVRPLIKRAPRRKTEREVWGPNFFPELSRVRRLTDKTNWAQVVAITAALSLLLGGVLQLAHPQGLVGAVEDAAGVVADVGGAVGDAFTVDDPPAARRDPEVLADNRSGPRDRVYLPVDADGPRSRPVSDATSDQPPSEPDEAPQASPPQEGKIAWTRRGDSETNQMEIWVMEPDGSNQTRLTHSPRRDYWPDWSPDGQKIAFTRGGLWIMNADGSGQRDLGLCPRPKGEDAPLCADPDWSPDGSKISFLYDEGVYVADLRSKRVIQLKALTTFPIGGPTLRSLGPSWAPDGQHLAGLCGVQVCIVDIDKPRRGRVVDFRFEADEVAWSPRGDVLAVTTSSGYSSSGLYLVAPDGSGTQHIFRSAGLVMGEATWSDDGRSIAFSGIDFPTELYKVDADGSDLTRLTVSPDTFDYMADWWGPSS